MKPSGCADEPIRRPNWLTLGPRCAVCRANVLEEGEGAAMAADTDFRPNWRKTKAGAWRVKIEGRDYLCVEPRPMSKGDISEVVAKVYDLLTGKPN